MEQMEQIDYPDYYHNGPQEAIDLIEAFEMNFNLGNVIKYVVRAGHKPGESTLTALKKANWYLNREIAKQLQREAEEEEEQYDCDTHDEL